ncbi:MAG: hypothetical protein N2318_10650 [Meiothermus sp.]|nr:hypothetical protein [Meiothermus sp.]
MDKTKRLPKRRTTFLVRCWLLPGGSQRYQVRHVQSGLEAQTDSLEAALQWMEQFRLEQSKPE